MYSPLKYFTIPSPVSKRLKSFTLIHFSPFSFTKIVSSSVKEYSHVNNNLLLYDLTSF